MADTINKIKWVITLDGLNAIEEAIAHPDESIFLPYIKFGDANGEYYDPETIASEHDAELKHVVFTSMVNKKSKSESDEHTVIFSTELNEEQGGFTVREIGLYSVKDLGKPSEKEYLFAVGTCEPFTKPTLSDDYAVYLAFDVCIRYDNLMEVYDRITIDEDSEYATMEDLNNVVKDMLYIEGNLMEQINNNTKINGLSRVSQLYELINESVQVYSGIFSNFNYNALLNQININNILGYWVFSYNDTSYLWHYIPDIGIKGNFLNLSSTATSFTRGYTGIASYLDISENKYYEIDTDANIDFCIKNIENPSGRDLPFTLFFCLSPNSNSNNKESIYLGKFNERQNKRVFTIGKNDTNGAFISFYTDADKYVTFSTIEELIKPDEFIVLGFRYNGDRTNPEVDIFINGKNVGTSKSNVNYSGMDYDISKELIATSYVTNQSGTKINYADAKFVQEIIIDKYVSDNSVKTISYNLMSIMGLNVCYRISST